jgi:hypothetical protein
MSAAEWPRRSGLVRAGLAGGLVTALMALTVAAAGAAQASVPVAAASPRGILPASPTPGNAFGAAVAISGSTAIVGARGYNRGDFHHVGAAYIYVRSGSTWHRQATLLGPGCHASECYFGASVAIYGSTVAIGSPGAVDNAGAVYVYTRSGSAWKRQVELAGTAQSDFGTSVALSGATLLVGADGVNLSAGAAYVYTRSNGGWHLQQTLSDPAGLAGDQFGESVALSGTTTVIGTGVATAYIYARSGFTWSSQATLTDNSGELFGNAVALAGDTAVIGATAAGGGAGAVYVYARAGSTWHKQARVPDPPDRVDSQFGASVAVAQTSAGMRILVGAPQGQPSGCGTAYDFVPRGAFWHEERWTANRDCTSGDDFGAAVALAGRLAIVGVPGINDNSGEVSEQAMP